MIIKVVLITIAVLGCLIFGSTTFFSIKEILLNSETITFNSFLYFFTLISAFLFVMFACFGWWVCCQFIAAKDDKDK